MLKTIALLALAISLAVAPSALANQPAASGGSTMPSGNGANNQNSGADNPNAHHNPYQSKSSELKDGETGYKLGCSVKPSVCGEYHQQGTGTTPHPGTGSVN